MHKIIKKMKIEEVYDCLIYGDGFKTFAMKRMSGLSLLEKNGDGNTRENNLYKWR